MNKRTVIEAPIVEDRSHDGRVPAWALKVATRAAWRKDGLKRPLTRGERNCKWIETHCRIPEGKDVGKAVRLRDWQAAIVILIYDNPEGPTRRAIISFGKKNAKTSLSAFLVLLHLVGPESRPNQQIPSTAQSREQAAALFGLAAKVVQQSPTLEPYITIREGTKQLYSGDRGTLYKALSAEDKTAHGQSPAFAVHDELGQVTGPISKLYDAIENAMGAHEEPLSIVISTQAPSDGDLLSQLIDRALKGDDPSTVCVLYTAPDELPTGEIDAEGKEIMRKVDPFSDEALALANPAFGDFLNPRELRRQAKEARDMPAKEASYKNFVLNQRISTRNRFVSREVWKKNGGPVEWPSDRRSLTWYAGLDLSRVNDLTALVLIAEYMGNWLTESFFWLPEEGLEKKAEDDKVPWTLWRDQKLLNVTPGPAIDYRFLAHFIYRLFKEREIAQFAFDRWKYDNLRPLLAIEGFREDQLEGDESVFMPFGQGFKSISPALDALEADLLHGRVKHGSHPILNLCADNAVVVKDPADNRKLHKPHSHGRIDGLVALAMARGAAGVYEEAKKPVARAMIF